MSTRSSLAVALGLIDRVGRRRLVISGVLTILMAIAASRPPVLIGQAVDAAVHAGGAHLSKAIVVPIVLACVFFMARPLLEAIRRRHVHFVAGRAQASGRRRAVEAVNKSRDAGADPAHLSIAISRGTMGVEQLILAIGADLAGVVFQVTIAVLTCFAIGDLRTGLAVLGVIPILLTLTLLQIRTEGKVRVQLEDQGRTLDGDIHEVLDGGDVLVTCGAIATTGARVEDAGHDLADQQVGHHVRMARWDTAKAIVETAGQLVVVALGLYDLLHGRSTAGAVLAVVALQQQMLTPLREVHRILDQSHQALAQVAELARLTRLPALPRYATVRTSPASTPRRPTRSPLVVHDLAVGVDAPGAHRPLLAGITLTIDPHEKVAVVGASGAGKSTLVRALAGLNPDVTGDLRYGDLRLSTATDDDLLALVSYLPQRPYVRVGTLRDNLVLTPSETASDMDLTETCTALGLGHVLLRGGLDFRVERLPTGDYNLSGGELQRVALARALLRRTPVLVLDEPTSALDPASASAVAELIKSYDGIVIAITHADPTPWCDSMITVADGTAVHERRWPAAEAS